MSHNRAAIALWLWSAIGSGYWLARSLLLVESIGFRTICINLQT
ncbi:hypothetical protein [Microcoleus sp. OTE_8_concoct_300]